MSKTAKRKKDLDGEQMTVLRGTLDMLVLSTLGDEPMHGYAIALALQQTTDDVLRVEEGSLYPALYRMEKKGWVASSWGRSEANRRARYYRLTAAGERHLVAQTEGWERFVEAVGKVITEA
ncbi:MAG: PadR family transcriptional regulator [Acidobacteriota bacterium]|jgi:transcriptional regulator